MTSRNQTNVDLEKLRRLERASRPGPITREELNIPKSDSQPGQCLLENDQSILNNNQK